MDAARAGKVPIAGATDGYRQVAQELERKDAMHVRFASLIMAAMQIPGPEERSKCPPSGAMHPGPR